MKRLFLLCSLVITIFGCSDHPATKEEKVDTFDYVAYHYSLDSLREPKVMIYLCDSGNLESYDITDTTYSGDQIILSFAGYNSEFQPLYKRKIGIGKDSVSVIKLATKARKDTMLIDWQLIRHVNSRIQPFGDKASYIISKTRKQTKEWSGGTTVESGHFMRASAPSIQNYYKGKDCIDLTTEITYQYLDSNQHKRKYRYSVTSSYAKNVGCIYFELYDPRRKNHISKYKLENIISLKEFEKMRASHIVSK